MKKNRLITILVLVPMILTSCGLKQNTTQANASDFQNKEKESITDFENDNNYEFLTKTSDYRDMKIKFPQVVNMVSSDKQKKINELIKKEVYGFVDYYLGEDEEDKYWGDYWGDYWGGKYELDIEYTIKLKTSKFLSIQFSVDVNDLVIDSVVYDFFTVNIDLSNAKKVRLKDFVRIDENFVEKFLDKIHNSYDINEQPTCIVNTDDEYPAQYWINMLEETDQNSSDRDRSYSYLTEDSIGIDWGVPYEIKYKNIKNNLLGDYYIWIQQKESSK